MLSKIKDIIKQAPAHAAKLKNTDQHLVALDIGTENVKALVCRISGDGAEIIGVGRAHQGLQDMAAGAVADIGAVVANCDAALNDAERQAGVSARNVVIGIAGERVKGMTTTVSVRRRDPKKSIDLDELERIIGLAQERARLRTLKQLKLELGGKEIDIKLVNCALVRIEIDGLEVTNPVNFQGGAVTLQLYTAFSPLVHISALERIAHDLDLDILAVAAEPFAVARSVMGNDPSANTNAILIDIGGGTTDIALLNEGGVEGTKMFGIGGRVFTRGVERDLGVTYEAAEKAKLALSEGKKMARQTEVEASLRKTLQVWISGVELALAEFDALDHLPHQIFLCGGGASLQMLMHELATSQWYRELPFTRKPSVSLIDPERAVGMVDKTDMLNDHTYITALGLARVGIDSVTQADTRGSNSVKEKINRILAV